MKKRGKAIQVVLLLAMFVCMVWLPGKHAKAAVTTNIITKTNGVLDFEETETWQFKVAAESTFKMNFIGYEYNDDWVYDSIGTYGTFEVSIVNASGTSVYEKEIVSSYDDVSISTTLSKGNYTLRLTGTYPDAEYYVSASLVDKNAPSINKTSLNLKINESATLSLSSKPSGLSWKSSNTKVAKVTSAGKVVAVASGSATITTTYGGYTYSCKVTVAKPTLNKSSLELKIGETYKLKVSDGVGSTSFKSADKKTATVDKNGKVKALKPGTVKITVKIGNESVTCTVKVVKPTLNYKKKTLSVGTSTTLKVKNAKSKASFSSNNKAVATVDKNGKISAKKKGTATITAKVGSYKMTCKVSVKENVYSASPSKRIDDYEYGGMSLATAKANYKNGALVLKTLAVNNRMFGAVKFDWVRITVYEYDTDKVIASKKFKNVNIGLDAYDYKNMTFTFDKKSVKKKNSDLRESGVYIEYEYYYTYSY